MPEVKVNPPLIKRVDRLKADTLKVPVTVNNPANVVVEVLSLSVNVPAILVVADTFNEPVVETVNVAPLFIASEVKKTLLVPITDTVPAAKVVSAPLVWIVPSIIIVAVAVIVPDKRTEVTLKVAPVAFVKPPSILTLFPVVTASVLNVPLLVINPVKVLTPLSLLSLKVPSIVVVPAIVRFPVEVSAIVAPVAIDRFPEAVVLSNAVELPLNVNDEFAKMDKFPAMVVFTLLPVIVKPPLPLIFSAPFPAMVLLKLIAVVASMVVPDPNVAAPAVNVPAVFVNPFVNTMFATVVTEVDVQLPEVFVTNPVNVLIPVLLASVMVPAVDVVPLTVKVAVLRLNVAPLFTVKFPASFKVKDPAPKFNVPLEPVPTTIEPTLFEGEMSSVTVCVSWIVTVQPEQVNCPG